MTNRGFGTVALLTLLPLVLTLLASVASAFLLFRSDAKMRHQCRTQLLQAQESVASHLQELLGLNPHARRLRLERELADREVDIAPPGPAGAAARAHQAYVIDMQMVLASQQRRLIAQASLESRQGPMRTTSQIRQSAKAEIAIYRNGSPVSPTARTVRFGTFDVRPSPVDSLTPDYGPAETFTESQTMRVRWKVGLNSLLPEWVKTWVPLHGLDLAAECSATLAKVDRASLKKTMKEKEKWLPILSAVNP